jgi:hypothetical protein
MVNFIVVNKIINYTVRLVCGEADGSASLVQVHLLGWSGLMKSKSIPAGHLAILHLQKE